MSSIHYKFRSAVDYKTLTFDGLHISVGDLKRLIYDNEKINNAAADFDLQICNASSNPKVPYEDENALIPRNSSVIVARVPAAKQQRLPKVWDKSTEGVVQRGRQLDAYGRPVNTSGASGIDRDEWAKRSDLSEVEKLRAMERQATDAYDPSNYARRRIQTGQAPVNYICSRCSQPGHWLSQCPLLSLRRTTGIPRDELMETTPDDPQAMVTAKGNYVVPILHKVAKIIGKKEKAPFLDEDDDGRSSTPEIGPSTGGVAIPNELLCKLCNDLLKDAVLVRCCCMSFCDECIRSRLLESDHHQCPYCHKLNVDPDSSLLPNAQLRQAVNNFRNETGYAHLAARRLAAASEPPAAHTFATLPAHIKTSAEPCKSLSPASSQASSFPQILPTVDLTANLPKQAAAPIPIPPYPFSSNVVQSHGVVLPQVAAPGAATVATPVVASAYPPTAPAPVEPLPVAASVPVVPVPYQTHQPPPPGVVATAAVVTPVPTVLQYTAQPQVATLPPAHRPLTEEEFYLEKRRLLEKMKPKDEWEEFLERKDRKKKRRPSSSPSSRSESGSDSSVSRSRSRSKSRSHQRRRDSKQKRSNSKSRRRDRTSAERHRRRSRSPQRRHHRSPTPPHAAYRSSRRPPPVTGAYYPSSSRTSSRYSSHHHHPHHHNYGQQDYSSAAAYAEAMAPAFGGPTPEWPVPTMAYHQTPMIHTTTVHHHHTTLAPPPTLFPPGVDEVKADSSSLAPPPQKRSSKSPRPEKTSSTRSSKRRRRKSSSVEKEKEKSRQKDEKREKSRKEKKKRDASEDKEEKREKAVEKSKKREKTPLKEEKIMEKEETEKEKTPTSDLEVTEEKVKEANVEKLVEEVAVVEKVEVEENKTVSTPPQKTATRRRRVIESSAPLDDDEDNEGGKIFVDDLEKRRSRKIAIELKKKSSPENVPANDIVVETTKKSRKIVQNDDYFDPTPDIIFKPLEINIKNEKTTSTLIASDEDEEKVAETVKPSDENLIELKDTVAADEESDNEDKKRKKKEKKKKKKHHKKHKKTETENVKDDVIKEKDQESSSKKQKHSHKHHKPSKKSKRKRSSSPKNEEKKDLRQIIDEKSKKR